MASGVSGVVRAEDFTIDDTLVRRLLAAQFPEWADLPLQPISSAGSDNAIYRLGESLTVRLPLPNRARFQVDKEHLWLPRIAPSLPLAIPVPLAKGAPGEGYPRSWSVYRWLAGEDSAVAPVDDPRQAAVDLAGFVAALWRIDTAGGPTPGPQNFFRGGPLADNDSWIRAAIADLDGLVDTHALTAVWDAALDAPAWDRPPVWIHGDLHDGNLLVVGGRLSAVLDFGGLGVADPACDLMAAWTTFVTAATRPVLRSVLAVDDATWARGRGWGLTLSLPSRAELSVDTPMAADSRRRLEEFVADHRHGTFSRP
ncbi:aminoglycoside phosphotransferase family protein [Actinopolymorpha pittospori]|uniref:Aminoglycoside phosphotransferase (APT) family kinase protein n=1 Tax=Actinopolymorpha pittospori TaxID=648752 RepID=A0A927RHH4_9ACTN|nr:aminoglycoside phosphotransferase family protein [Actinopolymorpha pittospori]MBE1612210.1 aminoglycoside phosphotransferase (APT) family kinase protein [Actinopolymorpha pittospori]